MSDSNFKIETSQRIQRLPPYLFGRINKMKYEKRVAGVDIIDLGMGNPTDPTPDSVVEKLAEAAKDPRNHRYSVSNGVAGLRREVAKKYRDKYGVELDPETEVIATIGSKEGFSHLCLALLGPGDETVTAHGRAHRRLPGALPARFDLTRARAAITIGRVGVVARLGARDDPVAGIERYLYYFGPPA